MLYAIKWLGASQIRTVLLKIILHTTDKPGAWEHYFYCNGYVSLSPVFCIFSEMLKVLRMPLLARTLRTWRWVRCCLWPQVACVLLYSSTSQKRRRSRTLEQSRALPIEVTPKLTWLSLASCSTLLEPMLLHPSESITFQEKEPLGLWGRKTARENTVLIEGFL